MTETSVDSLFQSILSGFVRRKRNFTTVIIFFTAETATEK
jgi:hypothetical protein